MNTNAGKSLNLSATDSAPKPGDFPLGSPLSRAAARAKVERMEQASKTDDTVVRIVGSDGKVKYFSPDGEKRAHAGAMVITVRAVKPDRAVVKRTEEDLKNINSDAKITCSGAV
jgi:hypothetical protein